MSSSPPPTLAAPDAFRCGGGSLAWISSASDGRRGTAESDSERGGDGFWWLPRRAPPVRPPRPRCALSSCGSGKSSLRGWWGEIERRIGRSSSATAGARCRMSSCVGDGSARCSAGLNESHAASERGRPPACAENELSCGSAGVEPLLPGPLSSLSDSSSMPLPSSSGRITFLNSSPSRRASIDCRLVDCRSGAVSRFGVTCSSSLLLSAAGCIASRCASEWNLRMLGRRSLPYDGDDVGRPLDLLVLDAVLLEPE